jgi:hypothetical protein
LRRLPTIIGAGLVAAATASAIAVTSGTAQAPGDRTLTFVEREVSASDVLADVPPLSTKKRPVSNGDSFLFESTVLDATGATKVGRFRGQCTFAKVTRKFDGSVALCNAVYLLQDGTITASASLTLGPGPTVFAVTGGTGAYEGARGSGTSKDRPGNNNPLSDTTIHLLP